MYRYLYTETHMYNIYIFIYLFICISLSPHIYIYVSGNKLTNTYMYMYLTLRLCRCLSFRPYCRWFLCTWHPWDGYLSYPRKDLPSSCTLSQCCEKWYPSAVPVHARQRDHSFEHCGVPNESLCHQHPEQGEV